MPTCGDYIVVLRSCLNEFLDLIIIPNVSPSAKIGNAWRGMPKDGELFARGVLGLGVRRKPQEFAADAVSLWTVNPSLLIINELELSNVMPRWRTQSAHRASVGPNKASAPPAASFWPAIQPEHQFRTSTRQGRCRRNRMLCQCFRCFGDSEKAGPRREGGPRDDEIWSCHVGYRIRMAGTAKPRSRNRR